MAKIPAHIRLPARIDSLNPLLAFVRSCAEQQGLGPERLQEIDLVMEEILVNIFNYAYPDHPGEVEVACRLADDGRLLIEVADAGVSYNMLSREDPDLKAGIDERGIGGLGVFFVKQLVRDIQYRREDDRNILTLKIDSEPRP